MKHGDNAGDLGDLPPGTGGTGEYPLGSIGPDDDGELKVAVGVDTGRGLVFLAFGEPVAWIGMTGPEARDFALRLLERAKDLS